MWRPPPWKLETAEYIGHRLTLAELTHVVGDTIKCWRVIRMMMPQGAKNSGNNWGKS